MPTPVSRRTSLAATALLAGAPLAACSLRPSAPVAGPPPPNPDRPLLDSLTARITRLLPHAPAPWYAAHVAQLQALGAPRQHHGTAAANPPDLAAERSLRDALANGAVSAQSPEFVRLLTSMAAGQAQLLADA